MSSSLQHIMSQLPAGRLAVIIASPIIGFAVGYIVILAERKSLTDRLFGASDAQSQRRSANKESDDASDDDDEDADISDLRNPAEECKLVLVVRTDLGMGKGKIAAQCSHATLACYKSLLRTSPNILKQWERLGQAKIALQSHGEDELALLQAQAISLGICAKVIHDAGRTQIAAGSATVLGVGPAEKSRVDMVTGHLKLL